DVQHLISLATNAYGAKPANPNLRDALGAANYRAGNYTAALEWFNRGAEPQKRGRQPKPETLFFLAMTHHHLGNTEQAKQILSQAVAEAAAIKDAAVVDTAVLRCLRQEAEGLIQPSK